MKAMGRSSVASRPGPHADLHAPRKGQEKDWATRFTRWRRGPWSGRIRPGSAAPRSGLYPDTGSNSDIGTSEYFLGAVRIYLNEGTTLARQQNAFGDCL